MATVGMELLLWNLQPRGERRHWHGGPTPLGALRGVSADEAAWRPTPRRKSIWELALHIAYWNHRVRRRLEGGAGPRFPRSPANFPALPVPADHRAWRRDVALLKAEHERLVEVVRALPESRLSERPAGGRRWTFGELVLGVAAHDIYHTGQIQSLKRLWQERALLGRS